MILIELDRPRHLMYDMNALCDADQKLEYKLLEILKANTPLLDSARILLWAGLKHEDPGLTIEQAGKLMDLWMKREKSIVKLTEKIIEAIIETGYFEAAGDGGRKNLQKSRRTTKG